MKNLFLIILLFALQFPAIAKWEWQNPYPTGATLNCVKFTDSLTGWLVGNYGQIFKTTDGGINWFNLESGTIEHLNSIVMINKLSGFIVGNGGIILKTIDGGDNWSKQIYEGKTTLRQVFFIDSSNGWIVGTDKTLLKTNDGGISWILIVTDYWGDYQSVFFINKDTGWIAGELGIIYKTTTGGKYWTQLEHIYSAGEYCSIQFVDLLTGWFIGGSTKPPLIDNVIVKTVSGGDSLFYQRNGSNAKINSSYFINTSLGWCVDIDGGISKTTDGGNSWTINYYSVKPLNSIHMIDKNSGWTVGGTYGPILKTTDGGENWEETGNVIHSDLNDVQFVNKTTGFAVGNGVIIKTTNSGKNWLKINLDHSEWYSCSFLDSLVGWVSCFSDYMIKTTDGGNSWIKIELKELYDPFLIKLFFTNPNIGYALTFFGNINKTIDGGYNWSKLDIKETREIRCIQFIDSTIGWAAGADGLLIKTIDGGNSWEHFTIDSSIYISNLFFIDNDVGWLKTLKGKFYKTTDGGLTWNENISANPSASIMFFANQDFGIITNNNDVYLTTDGGVTWNVERLLVPVGYNDAFFIDKNNGWIIGENGTILKYTADSITSVPENIIIPDKPTIAPNPISDYAEICFTLSHDDFVDLTLFSLTGEKLKEISNGFYTKGKHCISLVNEYSPGMYFVVMKTSNGLLAEKMMILGK